MDIDLWILCKSMNIAFKIALNVWIFISKVFIFAVVSVTPLHNNQENSSLIKLLNECTC